MNSEAVVVEEEPIQDVIKATIVTTAASEATTAVVGSFATTTIASVGVATAVRAAASAAIPAVSIGLLAYSVFTLLSSNRGGAEAKPALEGRAA